MEVMEHCSENLTYSNYYELSAERFKEMEHPWKYKPEFKVTAATYLAAFLIGGIGNAAIVISLIVISKRQSHASNNTSLFLASLTLADLLLLFVYIPLEFWRQIDTDSVSAGICKMTSYVEMLAALASVINLTAVSIERYIVIVHPMRSRSLCTLSNCRKALVSVWLISCVLALPVLYTNDVYSTIYVEANTTCIDNSNSIVVWKCTEDTALDAPALTGILVATYQMVMIFLFPAILMTSSYYKVIKTLWRSTKDMQFLTNVHVPSPSVPTAYIHSVPEVKNELTVNTANSLSPTPVRTSLSGYEPTRINRSAGNGIQSIIRPKRVNSQVISSASMNTAKVNQSRKQIIKMLLVIILLFIICWCPRFLLNLLKWYSDLLPQRPDFFVSFRFYYVTITAKILPVIHAMLNPIIYSLMCRSVRRTILSCCCCSVSQVNTRGKFPNQQCHENSFELQEQKTKQLTNSCISNGSTKNRERRTSKLVKDLPSCRSRSCILNSDWK